MFQLPDNVRQNLIKLVPSSLLNEVLCFVFYDNHPRDDKNIDVVICTKQGEIKEYYQRDLVLSCSLDISRKPQDIRILRSSKCALFYLVATDDDIIILRRKDDLQVCHRLSNIDKYEIDDLTCRGCASLKITRKDDAVPLIFDDDFKNFGDRPILPQISSDESLPIVTQLKRKLTEAKYSVKCNEKAYKELVNLRQLATFSNYQDTSTDYDDAVFRDKKKDSQPVTVKTQQQPWVKICNGKLVIKLEVLNKNDVPIEEVHILIHSNSRSSLTYVTKLFQPISESPFWEESNSQNINSNSTMAVAAVMDLKELKNNVTSKIEFNGVISYKMNCKEKLLPFANVYISALDTMGENFDVLYKIESCDVKENILGMLCTTVKVDLRIRYIKSTQEHVLDLMELFCKQLQMERLLSATNVLIHRNSPYHTLHGCMLVLHRCQEKGNVWTISFYTRTVDQVLAAIHYIHDAIPYRLIITTVDQIITGNTDGLSEYTERESPDTTGSFNYGEYAKSVLKQTSTVLEYLDDCMIKMNESKNTEVINRVGSEIDMFAGNVSRYMEFRNRVLDETARGIKSLKDNINARGKDSEVIDIDMD